MAQKNNALSIDKDLAKTHKGKKYYPLDTVLASINPCAGKKDNTSCGSGCVCLGGQCHYTLYQLTAKGFSIE